MNTFNLTRREREVATLLSVGLKARAIADRLAITEFTVRDHTRALREKTKQTSTFVAVLMILQDEREANERWTSTFYGDGEIA